MQVGQDQTACTSARAGEDDMTDGDLGDGMSERPKALSNQTRHQARSRSQGDFQELLSPTHSLKRNSDGGGGKETFSWTPCSEMCSVLRQELNGGQLPHNCRKKESVQVKKCQHLCSRPAYCHKSLLLSILDLCTKGYNQKSVHPHRKYHDEGSSEELQRKLQEVTQEVELLRSELEVTHRHLEGKHEALRILQGHAILDKATTHTKHLFQKSEERAKALEKEVNALQWEINFNQARFKNFEQSWEQKYERVCSENQALSESLEERTKEMQALRTENTSLNQQCLELLGTLSAQDRSEFQGTQPPSNQGREGSVLELAVFGACQCPSSLSEPCPCARSAAASRKQVLQLKQELKTQRRKMDEAFVMADAFRIAFEQQLRRGSEHVLHLAESDTSKTLKKHWGKERQGSLSIGQRLKGLLPSAMIPKDPYETLHMLLDLLSDKEEALAHQRKVSYMLARNTEDLEKRLHIQWQGSSADTDDLKTSKNAPGKTSENAPGKTSESAPGKRIDDAS
ncbi:coiled-coil domain-containing protein 125 isoform X1 [Clupea harengus]|uniref:Coiled-coil domain-containing protein 125 isoform X1 n=1 Tax=Clupea harengus TaxID=7950 RepID=A0A6P8FRR7_CLUHA|nr:coiled-coil domain-containing protein 125 isoform X1 [Clupea harengus]